MNRRWVLSLLVAIGAISAVTGATVASADFRGGVHGGEVLDRVAGILGIERGELDDAFAQARSEIHDEKQAEALASLVEDGTLTREEVDAISDWLSSRPSAVDGITSTTKAVFKFHRGSLDRLHSNGALNIPAISSELLANLVATDKLSQEDADAIQAWLDVRPEAVDKLVPEPIKQLEGIRPFGGGGLFGFGEDGEPLELEGLREQLEQFRSDLEANRDGLEGELPEFPGFEIPEGGFFQFDGDGFEFEFNGDGPEFFFRGGTGDRFRGFGHGFRGIAPFHDFTPAPADSSSDPEPINL
ncbi:MAG: hypothetical protein HOC77_06565 [Chloroflexi bacterium]|nr:hypothetical protein [Chloroflexota bacterium]MBT4073449.1 hypothetical protein [Chloroflexota bacterium]MBT4514738.1 hypothetical protein [Chloroflexota bacterium]MBT5318343.1 hypothetical protein [Chloroflexota bacterium]MBT6680992.1 hypothetical protein [Chloroflexota bacterium]